jgi:hypothetical protein
MCTRPELIAAVSAVCTIPMVVWSIYLQHKFNRSLQAAEPSQWAELGTKGYFKYDESPKEAAFQWYLLTGQYRYLSDDELVRKGNHARWATIASFATVCIGMLATEAPSYTSVFACLRF